ncbi:MAG: DNA topoisomerase IV subunit A [Rhodospirillales bacterium]|nr:MAG: DNA topoisomerase IV subunit A [Rhodospirillales bacterium]
MPDLVPEGGTEDVPFTEALSQRYLSYALSTIVSRSLPDVRDGLKPVHRRLLYAMRDLGLNPEAAFKKCARVVGDVIGRFHPHGDVAVYDALVRLAQEFAVRYPLVDGQGNFGNVDGDNAAAMRYTEARLTAVAAALLEGIDEDAVDFRATYDGEDAEPVVLPARFPNLLANGASGIAVGMATSIPPHNVGEICRALRYLIKHPAAGTDKLLEFIPAPDFPTGGVLIEPPASIADAYRTGRGSFRLRARWAVEPQARGTWIIAVSEIPYQVQKSRLIERIAELMAARKLPFLADVRDESTDVVRIVLEPRSRTLEPATLMEPLFRLTDLEVRIGLNMNVLDGGITPKVMNLAEVLRAFLDHRHTVLIRRSRFRLEKIRKRLEILDGFLVVYLDLDEVIRIVREEDEPKPALMRRFDLSEVQAEAVLNMRLRQLRRLEEWAIRKEHESLSAERSELEILLGDESRRWATIGDDLAQLAKAYGPATVLGRRRTVLEDAPAVPAEAPAAMIEREPITVIISEKGWVRTIKGHADDTSAIRYKEGDRERFVVHALSTDRLLVFASHGRFYTLACDRLPGGRGQGEPLRLIVDLPEGQEPVAVTVYQGGRRLLLASSGGRGFIVDEDDVAAQTRAGKQVLNLAEGDSAAVCTIVPSEADSVATVASNRKLLVFPLADLPTMARGRGVVLQRIRDGRLTDALALTRAEGLSWRSGPGVRTERDLGPWSGKRGQAGSKAPRGFPIGNRFG